MDGNLAEDCCRKKGHVDSGSRQGHAMLDTYRRYEEAVIPTRGQKNA